MFPSDKILQNSQINSHAMMDINSHESYKDENVIENLQGWWKYHKGNFAWMRM